MACPRWTPLVLELTVERGAGLGAAGAKRVAVIAGEEGFTTRNAHGGSPEWNEAYVLAFPPPDVHGQLGPLRLHVEYFVNDVLESATTLAVSASMITKTGRWSSWVELSPGSLYITLAVPAVDLGLDSPASAAVVPSPPRVSPSPPTTAAPTGALPAECVDMLSTPVREMFDDPFSGSPALFLPSAAAPSHSAKLSPPAPAAPCLYSQLRASEERCEEGFRLALHGAWREGYDAIAAVAEREHHAMAVTRHSHPAEADGELSRAASLQDLMQSIAGLEEQHHMQVAAFKAKVADAEAAAAASQRELVDLEGEVREAHGVVLGMVAEVSGSEPPQETGGVHGHVAGLAAAAAGLCATLQEARREEDALRSALAAHEEKLECLEEHYHHSQATGAFALCMKNLLLLSRRYWDTLRRHSVSRKHARALRKGRRDRDFGPSFNDLRAAVEGFKTRMVTTDM
eukprot:TRINITY_DN30600_c0_g1_i1.p1 TRINITY_DN30600_c0_g1~~TRINITY_DN30600_c0_g1_i1.p1  ORF type:complete len:457 (+),score=124.59 TRINITY_DN30600_c0_g1_i1:92-1462(+)